MCINRSILINAGIDMGEILENVGNDEKVMEHVLITFLQDRNFEIFNESYEKKEYENAFLAAHTLKGVFLNLGMKNLQNVCSRIVEKLRNKDYDSLDNDVSEFHKLYDKMRYAIMEVYK